MIGRSHSTCLARAAAAQAFLSIVGLCIVTATSTPAATARTAAATEISVAGAIAVRNQDHQHAHGHGDPEKLGRVSFPTSCAASVQAPFVRGVALLHSFWYSVAEQAFAEVATQDPSCTMAYWGVAMTQYRPVWAAPSAAEFEKGRAAVKQALAHEAKTPRERAYVQAVAAYFDNPAATDHRARARAYEQAMAALHEAHPDDPEGAIFYALALLGTASPTDKTYAQQKKAGALLNGVLPQTPDHPGVAHYLIHSFDSPALASLALDAARAYAQIAPSSPHALHMPSHIFTRLGYWDDSVGSNLASAASASTFVAKVHPGRTSFEELHALDYAVYAWLQRGADDKARAVVQRLATLPPVDENHFSAGYAIAAIPGRYALERRAWTEAAKLPVRQAGFDWDKAPYAELPSWFARALGAARAGDVAAAREAIAKMAALRATLVAAKDPYWPTQVDIQTQAAEAWIARAEGRDDEALRLMRASADLEDATEKHPVTPGSLLPARELLGDLLIDLKRAGDALREYETSLAAAPKRLNGLAGAARAAQQAGQRDKAKQYYAEVVALAAPAGGRVSGNASEGATRPAIAEARAFLASQ